jgi:nucleoside-diphosphate-sugar epimerase
VHDVSQKCSFGFQQLERRMKSTKILVTGAGGFIGHHLVKRLKSDGHWVRGVDLKLPEYEESSADEFQQTDLRNLRNCLKAVEGIDEVYNLAADMGGIGFISSHFATIARNNSLINLNMLEAARLCRPKRFLFSSSACVYNQSKQIDPASPALKEDDAHPAAPEKGYGWEKLYAEQLCLYYREEFGLNTKVVRFHNVYGPLGTYEGGREKAPAAACRKVALARDGDTIEIWGDGKQTRSFLYIDDCVIGLIKLLASDFAGPVNLGSTELITIDGLFNRVAEIAGKRINKSHDLLKPQGVRGRNSDNALLRQVFDWEPGTPLVEGLISTYHWIAKIVGNKPCG